MTVRGLVVALLCGLVGLGGGALVSYAVQPHPSTSQALVTPMPGLLTQCADRPPDDAESLRRRHHTTLRSRPTCTCPCSHTISNRLATWTYHVPEGWQAYAVCTPTDHCKPPMVADTVLKPRQIDRQPEVRFRPPDEPASRRLQPAGAGARQHIGLQPRHDEEHQDPGLPPGLHRLQHHPARRRARCTSSTATSRATSHRFNYFQWFAVPGDTTATLEMSVAGRETDVPGLEALFQRFAHNVLGSPPNAH